MAFIFYHYYKIEEEHTRENLFLKMKNYSFFFDDNRFDMDIVSKKPRQKPYELYMDEHTLYILVPMSADPNDRLKVFYPKPKYLALLHTLQRQVTLQFLLLTFIALLISALFAFYTLSPLRRSIQLLETFIKDMIHDLNTPITSILINLKMMDEKNEEVESITRSAKTISMLHGNLDAYLRQQKKENEKFQLKTLIDEQVAFFAPMYDYLQWEVACDRRLLSTDKNALGRILYNLLSNACKYNTSRGYLRITTKGTTLRITNSSYGIKDPSRLFERFYKESERGLGIGLHIVEVLCAQLHIPKKLTVKEKEVEVTLDLSQVTLD